jgi:hypothetical protein
MLRSARKEEAKERKEEEECLGGKEACRQAFGEIVIGACGVHTEGTLVKEEREKEPKEEETKAREVTWTLVLYTDTELLGGLTPLRRKIE